MNDSTRYSKSVADLYFDDGDILTEPTTVLLEGYTKFRDGKKWKNRWAVLSRLSPAADCLQLQFYKDERERARNGQTKASLSLQNFFCVETGFTLDKESHTLAIICQDVNVVLAFDHRERLIHWSVRILNNLGESQQFLVQLVSAPVKSKLNPGPVRLSITDKKFCLTGGIPPKLLGFWDISQLRRYGVMDGRLIFEGGSRCGKGEGVHVLVPDPPQMGQLVEALDLRSSKSSNNSRTSSSTTGSGRRTCSVDSPRKLINPRLSEIRSPEYQNIPLQGQLQGQCQNLSQNQNQNPSLCQSQGPRESRSAEELCKTESFRSHRLTLAQENTSRCDLSSCDSVSIEGETLGVCTDYHGDLQSPNPITGCKPAQAGGLERCLSCMSKLGSQAGQHPENILSPTWTMDLKESNNHGVQHNHTHIHGISHSSAKGELCGGSFGSSDRSDRLSISSHGSSEGQRYNPGHRYTKSRDEGRFTPPTYTNNTGYCPSTSANYNQKSKSQVFCNNFIVEGGSCQAQGQDYYDVPKMAQSICGNPLCTRCIETTVLARKMHRDRASIASSCGTTNQPMSISAIDFYDFPRNSCQVVNCQHCPNPNRQQNQQNLYSIPKDPLENYDIPPSAIAIATKEDKQQQLINHAIQQQNQQIMITSTTSSGSCGKVNGCGRMPLVSNSNSSGIDHGYLHSTNQMLPKINQTQQMPLVNNNQIYAQIDKSKKMPKNPQQNHCDKVQQQQGNYMNIDYSTGSGRPAMLPPKKTKSNNYANLDFSSGTCEIEVEVYENSTEIQMECRKIISDFSSQEKKKPKPNPKNINLVKEKAKDRNEKNDNLKVPIISNILPLRRSSSVPSNKSVTYHGAHRGSVSSSDSGVSDGNFFEDTNSLLLDFGSLCIHESLPRKSQTGGKYPNIQQTPSLNSTITANNPKTKTSIKIKQLETEVCTKILSHNGCKKSLQNSNGHYQSQNKPEPVSIRPDLSNRHYETIEEMGFNPQNTKIQMSNQSPQVPIQDYPTSQTQMPIIYPKIEVINQPVRIPITSQQAPPAVVYHQVNVKKSNSSASVKPRSGREYCKIDRGSLLK